MATSTFDRELELTNLESVIKLLTLEPATEPLSKHPYTEEDRKRGEELFRAWLSRSRSQCGMGKTDEPPKAARTCQTQRN